MRAGEVDQLAGGQAGVERCRASSSSSFQPASVMGAWSEAGGSFRHSFQAADTQRPICFHNPLEAAPSPDRRPPTFQAQTTARRTIGPTGR